MAEEYRACCENIGINIKQRIQEEYPNIPLVSALSEKYDPFGTLGENKSITYVIKEKKGLFKIIFSTLVGKNKPLVRINFRDLGTGVGYGVQVSDFKMYAPVKKVVEKLNKETLNLLR